MLRILTHKGWFIWAKQADFSQVRERSTTRKVSW